VEKNRYILKSTMKSKISIPILIVLSIFLQSLVVRHDIKDKDLLELAKKYPSICHFRNGEGTLIKSNWILTAGHLGNLYVNSTDSADLKVLCNGITYTIDKVIMHPDYNSEGKVSNDIALIKLKNDVEDVLPALLYSKKDEVNKIIILVGRGYPGNGLIGEQKNKWDHKTRAATNKVDTISGEYLQFGFDKPGSKKITRYEGVSGPGDSGGPAFYEVNGHCYIMGISSHQFATIEVDDHGKETGGPGHYGAIENYTRVSNYIDWIEGTIKKE
jgi:Trypsin